MGSSASSEEYLEPFENSTLSPLDYIESENVTGNETMYAPPAGPEGYSTLHIVIASIILTFMMIVVVIGNMLVIIAIATEKSLKNLQNWFIASLAVADFFVGLLIMPFSLANELMGYWIFGKVWCSIHSALDVLLCTSSIMNICLISLDRYWSITQAIEYLKKRTPARAAVMITMVWILSALISIPPLMGWKDDSPQNPAFPTCELSKKLGYVLYSAMGSFYIPSCIMVFVYIRIYFAARDRARRQIRKSPRPKPQTSSVVIDTEESARNIAAHAAAEIPLSPLKTSESSSSPKLPSSPTEVPNETSLQTPVGGGPTSPRTVGFQDPLFTSSDDPPPTSPNPEITVENCSPEISLEESSSKSEKPEEAKGGDPSETCIDEACKNNIGSPSTSFTPNSSKPISTTTKPRPLITEVVSVESSSSPTPPPPHETNSNPSAQITTSPVLEDPPEIETELPEHNNQHSSISTTLAPEKAILETYAEAIKSKESEANSPPFNSSVITVRDISKHPNIEKLRTDLSGAPISVMVTTAVVTTTSVPSVSQQSGRKNSKRPKLHFLRVDSPTIWRTSSSLSLNGDIHILGTMSRSGSRTQLEADPVSDMEPSSSDSGAISRCAVVKPLKLRLCQPFFGKKHASSTSSNKARRDVVDTGKLNSPKEIRDPEREKRRIARKKEKRATLILGLIMGSFILCWLPFFFLYIFSPLCDCEVAPWGFAIAFWLGYLNSALNPVIYTIFNKDFRRAFRRILFK